MKTLRIYESNILYSKLLKFLSIDYKKFVQLVGHGGTLIPALGRLEAKRS